MNDSTRSANAKTQRRSPGGQWMKESTSFNAVHPTPSINDRKTLQSINEGFASGKYDAQIIETLNMNGNEISHGQWKSNPSLRKAARDYFANRYSEAYR